jgi:4'-phosphopantetheinyl transferase EntD
MNRAQRSAAVERLFPPGVVAFELRGPASPRDLLASELRCVERAVEKRQREFAAGRLSARAALAALGCEPAPLLMGPDRMPAWPAGVVGSITHTDGYCVAVVGLATRYAALGVDAEYVGAVSPSLWAAVLHPEELVRIKQLNEARRRQISTLIFSAKEAFYKCQYSLTRRWLGFDEAVVKVTGSSFELSVLDRTHALHSVSSTWRGQFMLGETLVVAAIAAERGPDWVRPARKCHKTRGLSQY